MVLEGHSYLLVKVVTKQHVVIPIYIYILINSSLIYNSVGAAGPLLISLSTLSEIQPTQTNRTREFSQNKLVSFFFAALQHRFLDKPLPFLLASPPGRRWSGVAWSHQSLGFPHDRGAAEIPLWRVRMPKPYSIYHIITRVGCKYIIDMTFMNLL